MKIEDVQLENVMSVYSGLNGKCCCGCAGNHRYAAKHRVAAGKDRGYSIRDEEVNDKQVKRVFNILKGTPDLVDDKDDSFCSLVAGHRLYIVYLLPKK